VQTVRGLPWIGKDAAQALTLTLGSRSAGEELLAPLQAAIETTAAEAARKCVGWFVGFMSNLLPTVVLGHIAWRVGYAWYEGAWLPWTFYGMALTIFLLSLLPGYLLIVLAVRRGAQFPHPARILETTPDPSATAGLRQVRAELEQMQRDARQLSVACSTLRRTLADELPAEKFGSSGKAAEDE
jgi:hypothetical protein